MKFIIADTFQDSLAKLDPTNQSTVKQKAFDFQTSPDGPGFRLHKLDKAAEKNFWSISVNMDIRIIVYRDGDTNVLCYTGHHDEAYAWAERHKFNINEATGAAQIITTEKRVEEVVDVIRRTEVRGPLLFERYEDDYLLALGVPEEWLDAVKAADEDTFLEHLLDPLPPEAIERLMKLATGAPVPRPTTEKPADPFTHPDARSRFLVVGEDLRAMERALAAPWDKWIVFLHPSQREVVDADYSGPARVTGGAGTGKTVVALHRAARLAEQNPSAKILLTTFSKTLAARLRQNLERLVGPGAPELEHIQVTHLHHLAVETWKGETGAPLKILDLQRGLMSRIEEAIQAVGGSDLSAEFLRTEWEAIIDTEGIRTWEEYKDFSRAGRGVPLGARQRLLAWKVFKQLHDHLEEHGERTWQRICYETAFLLAQKDVPLYDHVVADEIQDFGPAELRLLRALVHEGRDDLFVTGDLGQRIYKGKTSFLGAGIDIRGRSTVLDINYRTTEQIRRRADRILPHALTTADGDIEPRNAVSLLSGPEPTFAFEKSAKFELEAAEEWLRDLLSDGYAPEDVAIFVRTNALVRNRARHVVRHCDLQFHELADERPLVAGQVSIGTMHRAKGLEFRAVMVMGCEASVLPYQKVLDRLPDQAMRDSFIEQEQNLLYVACTRARERLFLSSAGAPSAFFGSIG